MIIRVCKEENYVVIDKQFIDNPVLSLQAKAVLLYLLSKPDDWRVYENDIVNHCTNGKWAVRKAIKELISGGYMVRAQARSEDGTFQGYEYNVYECPMISTTPSVLRKPENGKPQRTNNNLTKGRSKSRKIRSLREFQEDRNSPFSTPAEEDQKRRAEIQGAP